MGKNVIVLEIFSALLDIFYFFNIVMFNTKIYILKTCFPDHITKNNITTIIKVFFIKPNIELLFMYWK